MHRLVSTDPQWAKMEPLCLGKPTDPGRTGGQQPSVSRSCAVDRPHRQPMEESAADVRQLEYGVQTLSRLGEGRRVQPDLRCRIG